MNNTKNPTKRGIARELRNVADIVKYPGDANTLAARTFLRTAARNLEHGWTLDQMIGTPTNYFSLSDVL